MFQWANWLNFLNTNTVFITMIGLMKLKVFLTKPLLNEITKTLYGNEVDTACWLKWKQIMLMSKVNKNSISTSCQNILSMWQITICTHEYFHHRKLQWHQGNKKKIDKYCSTTAETGYNKSVLPGLQSHSLEENDEYMNASILIQKNNRKTKSTTTD